MPLRLQQEVMSSPPKDARFCDGPAAPIKERDRSAVVKQPMSSLSRVTKEVKEVKQVIVVFFCLFFIGLM